MHDGRFFTLNQVLEHYNSGIQQSATLDPALSTGLPLNGTEKQQLIAFLKTLTDYDLLNDPWLRAPTE
jgi:cytochrome c peroxidase